MNNLRMTILSLLMPILNFFDKSLDSILKDFTKLDAKLDKAALRFRLQYEAEKLRMGAADAALNDMIAKAEKAIDDMQARADALKAEELRAANVRAKVQALIA